MQGNDIEKKVEPCDIKKVSDVEVGFATALNEI
jgi:hypothetical protein